MMYENEMARSERKRRDDSMDKLADMLAKALIDDPDTPEYARVSTEITLECSDFLKKLLGLTNESIKALDPNSGDESIAKGKAFLEYIRLTSGGFDTFAEAWKHGQI